MESELITARRELDAAEKAYSKSYNAYRDAKRRMDDARCKFARLVEADQKERQAVNEDADLQKATRATE